MACLQREDATVYIIAPHTTTITQHHLFGLPGDMEGHTRMGVYHSALVSDGLIHQLQKHNVRWTVSVCS